MVRSIQIHSPLREGERIHQSRGQVVLRKATAPPAVDEKLGEEEGTIREKNDALIMCRKYIWSNDVVDYPYQT